MSTPGEHLARLVADNRKLCDAPDVATVCGVNVHTVYDGVKDGTFPLEPIRLGRLIKFRVADVVALIEGPVNAA